MQDEKLGEQDIYETHKHTHKHSYQMRQVKNSFLLGRACRRDSQQTGIIFTILFGVTSHTKYINICIGRIALNIQIESSSYQFDLSSYATQHSLQSKSGIQTRFFSSIPHIYICQIALLDLESNSPFLRPPVNSCTRTEKLTI